MTGDPDFCMSCLVPLLLLLLQLMLEPATPMRTREIERPEDGESFFVEEGTDKNSHVTTIRATDPNNAVLEITSIVDQSGVNRTGHFKIAGGENNYVLKTNFEMNYEDVQYYIITVSGTWSGPNAETDDVTFTVNVVNVDDEPPTLPDDPSIYTTQFDEEQPPDTVVFPAFNVTDSDSSSFTFSLSGDNATYFNIDPSTGAITIKDTLDSDAEAAITMFSDLQLHVTDSAGNAATPKALTVHITDINDNPPLCSPANYHKVYENSVPTETKIVTLQCTDNDTSPSNDIVSYAIVSGDDGAAEGGAKFSMMNEEVHTTAVAIDPAVKDPYILTVHVTDGGSLVATATVTVEVAGQPPEWQLFTPVGPAYSVSEDVSPGYLVATLTATDPDSGDAGVVEYYILSLNDTATGDDELSFFQLHATSGELKTASQLDYETVKSYTLVVKAQDKASPPESVTTTLTVNVLNVNDNDPVFVSGTYSVTIPELVARSGSWTGLQLSATDADTPGTSLDYQIVSGNTGEKFRFNSTQDGLLELNSAIDVDHPSLDPYSYILVVKAAEPGNPEIAGTATVTVSIIGNSNDHSPQFISPDLSSPVTIDETASPGALVTTFSAIDSDREDGSPQSVTYSLTSVNGDSSSAVFQLDPATGELKTATSLDYEDVPSYTLVVTAQDSGSPQQSQTLTLTVNVGNSNDNTPTFDSTSYTVSIQEADALSTSWSGFQLSATDADTPGTSLDYQIVSGNTGEKFRFNSTQDGLLELNSAIDVDHPSLDPYSYILVVKAAEPGNPEIAGTATVTVSIIGNSNDHSPQFISPDLSSPVTIDETASPGALVTTFSAIDSDREDGSPQSVTYSLTSVNGDSSSAVFQLDPATGELKTATSLDYEDVPSYTLVVTAQDSGSPQQSQTLTLTVNVGNSNDNTPTFDSTSYTVSIQEADALSTSWSGFQLSATDADTPGTSLDYQIVSGNTGEKFRFNSTQDGLLELNSAIDVDHPSLDPYSYILVVKAAEPGNPEIAGTATVTVSIIGNSNDHSPQFISPDLSSPVTIDETASPGALVTTFSAIDSDREDGSPQSVTYSLTSVNGDSSSAVFQLDPATGELKTATSLDYEDVPSYTLVVTAQDSGSPQQSQTLTLTVNVGNSNDNTPTFDSTSYTVSIQEADALSTSWSGFQLSATDADTPGTSLDYQIVSGNTGEKFRFNSTQDGLLELNSAIDVDHPSLDPYSYILVVKAAEPGNPEIAGTATVTVSIIGNSNDHSPQFISPDLSSPVTIDETASPGALVTTFSAIDSDREDGSPQSVTYSLTSVNGDSSSAVFQLDPATGELKTATSLDYEDVPSYTLVVTAQDSGSPQQSQTLTLTVNVGNSNDNTPTFDSTSYTVSIQEADALSTSWSGFQAAEPGNPEIAGTATVTVSIIGNSNDHSPQFISPDLSSPVHKIVGHLSNHRPLTLTVNVGNSNDNTPTFDSTSYTVSIQEADALSTSCSSAVFQLDPATGELKTATSLDYEDVPSYTLVVTAQDSGSPQQSQTLTLTVNVGNSNDNTPTFDSTSYTVSIQEADALSTSWSGFQLSATDADTPGTSLDYQIVSGNTGEKFRFNSTQDGLLELNSAIDVDHPSLDPYSYILVVKAAEPGNPEIAGTATVTVSIIGNSNDHSPQFISPDLSSPVTIDETASPGALVTTFSAIDSDREDGSPQSVTYSLTSVNGDSSSAVFQLDPATGELKTATSLDYEDVPSYTLVVTAQDSGSPQQSQTLTLTVNVGNSNDNTPTFDSTSYTVSIQEADALSTSWSGFQLSATDADTPGTSLDYQIVSGNTGEKFRFNSTQDGLLELNSAIDVDHPSLDPYSYILVVKAAEPGNPEIAGTATVTVSIIGNSNDHSPQFISPDLSSPVTIDETASPGALVTTFSAIDSDREDGSPQSVTYSLTSVNGDSSSAVFQLDPATGELKTATSLDYEDVPSYTLVVTAQDSGSPQQSQTLTLTVNVGNSNDNTPTFDSTSYTVSIQEADALSTSWSGFQLLATDADSPDADLQYDILSGDPENKFRFSNVTAGYLEQNSAIVVDHPENDPYYYLLTVQVSDEGRPEDQVRTATATATVTVTIISDSNDHDPVFGSPSPSSSPTIDETAPIGTKVATLPVTDADTENGHPQPVTYAIIDGNTDNAFTIDPVLGEVKTVRTLDHETNATYVLLIEARDSGHPARSANYSLTVHIANVNENAPACPSYAVVVSVEEGPARQQVVTLSCSDDDTGNTLTYAIQPPVPEFAISSDGAVTTLQDMDYETVSRYTFTVEVADSMTRKLTSTVTLTVNVLPVNEFDPVFSLSSYSASVSEGALEGTSVTTLTATDGDQGARHGTIRYRIVDGDDFGAFTINPRTGEITTTAAGLDRELGDGTHTLTVRANDDIPGAPSERTTDVTVTVTLTDVNDNVPLCSPVDYQTRIMEPSTAGVTVVTVTVTDDDEAGSLNASPILSVTGGDSSRVFGTSGLDLVLLKEVDHETRTFYYLTLTVSDRGTPSLSSTCHVQVTILGVADHPPVLTLPNYSTTISENTPVGTTIFDANATDLDEGAGSKVRYSIISGNDNNDFFCFPVSGKIIVWNPLDFDSLPQSYNLTIEARDDADLTDTMWLHVQLADLNDETPVFQRNRYRVWVRENAVTGKAVVSVVATDRDSGQNGTITYTAVGGNGMSLFTVDPDTGNVTTSGPLDRETRRDYSLLVRAADRGTPSLSSTVLVAIVVMDANDHAPVFTPAEFVVSVSEDVNVGTVVTSVAAEDGDAQPRNNRLNYRLYHSHFRVTESGQVVTKRPLDRETNSSYVLQVRAVDTGRPALTGTATITVIVDDVNDNAPVITAPVRPWEPVFEDASVNTVVTAIIATDADAGENARLSYVAVGGDGMAQFSVAEESGVVQVRKPLDREQRSGYRLIVEVRDNGSPRLTATTTVTIGVRDVNDNPPVWDRAHYSFSVFENEAAGTFVGQVNATDADIGVNGAVRYSVVLFWEGPAPHFTLHGVTGVISTTTPLDRESTPAYSAWIRVTDTGDPQFHADVNVSIIVSDRNDNPPVFPQLVHTATTPENEPVGTEVYVVTVTDDDIGVNANVTLTIDTSTDEGAHADAFFQVSDTGVVTVRRVIDRELDPTFTFTVLATDRGAPTHTSSATVIINIDDVNDHAPVFTQTYFNTEVSLIGQCSKDIIRLTATDADQGVRGLVTYYLLTSDVNIFAVDAETGEFSIRTVTLKRKATHLVQVSARDGGTPSLSADTPVLIRVDGIVAEQVVVLFELGITEEDFLPLREAFLQHVQDEMRTTHPRAVARLWCVGTRHDGLANVHVYFLEDDSTEDVANSNADKNLVTQDQARRVFIADPQGTPSERLSGNEWDAYNIQRVNAYNEQQRSWLQTTEGIIIMALAALLALLLLCLLIFMCCRYCKCGGCRHPRYDRDCCVRSEQHPVDRQPPLRRPASVAVSLNDGKYCVWYMWVWKGTGMGVIKALPGQGTKDFTARQMSLIMADRRSGVGKLVLGQFTSVLITGTLRPGAVQ
ncbi:protocadherin Fat 4-like [Babylonia areolata]|uniref:protocadherin Fat 4-like n=1 Tax=Babylonia areolata TaxID=304850 RepID=UPI003FD64D1A